MLELIEVLRHRLLRQLLHLTTHELRQCLLSSGDHILSSHPQELLSTLLWSHVMAIPLAHRLPCLTDLTVFNVHPHCYGIQF